MGTEIERRISRHLPEEIIEEILHRLPSKSLLRFKCVSKQWRSFISSKQFIKRHLNKSNIDTDLANRRLVSSFRRSPDIVGFMSLFRGPNTTLDPRYLRSLLNDDIIATLDSEHSCMGDSTHEVRIVGSCNGLVLITIENDHNLYLWNPCTREIKKIRYPRLAFKKVYGLGYDECADDYKVVCIFFTTRRTSSQTEVYSLKADSWKKIEHFDKGSNYPPMCKSGMLVNGRLHWLMGNDDDDLVIISLDLVGEKYEIVAGPENVTENICFGSVLNNLGGYLCLITTSSVTGHQSVWVMIEYGQTESWTKIWTCSNSDDSMKMWPLKKHGIYNGKNVWCKNMGCVRRVYMVDATTEPICYVESLVSPFGDKQLRR
ncbi:PREDICTED: F-box/kelch-repeat protein At3g23880-like [Erythranthe guttata]|nr:PREDICTED: F-box/kelch-repeat protein At3g23880-like [Erythranthe guttata]|eukprot:XP_012833483.1 PREDICTED: F-box/kelch-repeat protein At3g23880-like [Erythranthe guttata]